MAVAFNIKPDAHGYHPLGTPDWGIASRHLSTLENVQFDGSQFESSRGLMIRIKSPLWDNAKIFSVRMQDLDQVVISDPGPGGDGPATIAIPEHTLVIEEEDGTVLGLYRAERTIYTKVAE